MNIESALVLSILKQYRSYEWTLQGFGFLRTKIENVGRIHIWDSRLAVPLVSTMHTHPWPLKSKIISGELINQRFVKKEDRVVPFRTSGLPLLCSKIATGEGGGLIGDPFEVEMFPCAPEHYIPGDVYEQRPNEVHRSIAQDGTVTLMERPQGPPLEEAEVFWPRGTNWVSAEPKKISDWQLEDAVNYALARWQAA